MRDLLDWTVRAVSYDAAGRALAIDLERGEDRARVRWRRVAAIGASRSARLGAASWLEDKLPWTDLRDVREEADVTDGWIWLAGDLELARAAPVRDEMAFVGGRFFKVLVCALAREREDRGDGA